jgi:titin
MTPESPSARMNSGLAWDPATSQMLLVGNEFNGIPETAAGADTWQLSPAPVAEPRITSVIAGNSEATLTWTAPDLGAGVIVSGYLVTSYPGDLTAWSEPDQLSMTFVGLTNGVSYQFSVTPSNNAGSYPSSPLSGAITPLGAPGPPSDVTAVCGDGAATVSWVPPTPSRSSGPVTSYEVFDESPTGVSVPGQLTEYTFTGLTNGSGNVFFFVQSVSAFGKSELVGSTGCTPYADIGAPVLDSVVVGSGQVTLYWSPPTTEGEPITGYQVSAAICVWKIVDVPASATSLVITGLPDNQACVFYVSATDAQGIGPPSDTSSPVVAEPPGDTPSFVPAAWRPMP